MINYSASTNGHVNGADILTWVVTPEEKATYDTFFISADKDGDGLVTGDIILMKHIVRVTEYIFFISFERA